MMKLNHFSLLASLSTALLTLAGCTSELAKQDGATQEITSVEEARQKSASDPDASSSTALTIGSVAPPINVEHWVSDGNGKFSPVKDFEEGKVYVVEFWATWCGPCIASMPHLAETQQRYVDEGVQLISISDEDLETVAQFLKRPFADGKEGGPETYGELTSAYCLTTDPDRSVYMSYMEAANQNGIPTAFIVGKTGRIEWIGHPMGMDQPLAAVLAGEWDRDGFKKYFVDSQRVSKLRAEVSRLASQGNTAGALSLVRQAKPQFEGSQIVADLERALTLDPIQRLVSQGDIDGAIEQMQQIITNSDTEFMPPLEFDLLALYLEGKRDEQTIAILAEMEDQLTPQMADMVSWKIYQRAAGDSDVSDELLGIALSLVEDASLEQPDNSSLLDTYAHLLQVQGDLDRAIEVQTRAVESAGASNAELEKFLQQLRDEKSRE